MTITTTTVMKTRVKNCEMRIIQKCLVALRLNDGRPVALRHVGGRPNLERMIMSTCHKAARQNSGHGNENQGLKEKPAEGKTTSSKGGGEEAKGARNMLQHDVRIFT